MEAKQNCHAGPNRYKGKPVKSLCFSRQSPRTKTKDNNKVSTPTQYHQQLS